MAPASTSRAASRSVPAVVEEKRNQPVSVREALLVGALWFLMNLVFDYPMFAYGHMRMSAARYYAEIGSGYLLYPAFLAAAAWAFGRRPQAV